MTKNTPFKFRKHERIVTERAEEDREFLQDSFVNTVDLAVIENTRDPRRIVVGRTGAGKTALLLREDGASHVTGNYASKHRIRPPRGQNQRLETANPREDGVRHGAPGKA